MMQAPYQLVLAANNFWRRTLIGGIFVLFTALSTTILIHFFHSFISYTTALFIYLFIIFWLIHRRKISAALFVALSACIITDFFLIQPTFSFSVNHPAEALDMALFLLFVLVCSLLCSYSQKKADQEIQREHAINLQYAEKLYKQTEETNRRECELRIFSDIVREMREVRGEQDLKRQLSRIAQAIDNAFSICGIRNCVFLLPDIEGTSLQGMVATQSAHADALSHEEEASAFWAIEHRKSVEIRAMPLIVRARGSYIRRKVTNNLAGDAIDATNSTACSSSYIVPLLSGSKVIGGIRLLIEDITHPRFLSIKKSLEMLVSESSDPQPDSFLEFMNQAIFLIEQALIERALKKQEEEQTALRHRIDEFYTSIISLVSHDLKTPLTIIKGAASSLLNQGETWNDEAERRLTLTEMVSEATRLELFINRMLEMSRIEQGKVKIEKELCPIEMIVLETLERRHMQALLQGHPIEKSGIEDLPPVEVDPTLIVQVLGNLLENAALYTPAGSPIEINGRVEQEQVVISVIDCGPGIPSTEKERIFEKFHRISRKMERGEKTAPLPAPFEPSVQGTGLGLAVCRGFVAAHNGRIWVENLDSGGAKFQFTLPLRQKRTTNEEDPHC
jgi:K+-sensing histidine kinase KdpD